MRFDSVEIFRRPHPIGFPHKSGDDFGWFEVNRGKVTIYCQASAGEGWEHLSASTRHRVPDWDEMCYLKSLFWEPEDCVVQYHPPESKYINVAKNCLHLWRPINCELPRPPSIAVGIK